MTGKTIATREFTLEDQDWFAKLSGDFNPIHVTPVVARRTLAGECVVHGLHTVLWALDQILDQSEGGIDALSVRFKSPVFLNTTVRILAKTNGRQIKLSIRDADKSLVDIVLSTGEPEARPIPGGVDRSNPRPDRAPVELDLQATRDLEGRLPLFLDENVLRGGFGRCRAVLGDVLLANLLALSRLVGMDCPGLHSLFSALKLQIPGAGSSEFLNYRVESLDTRFSLIKINVQSAAVRGNLDVFLRPRPVQSPTLAELAGRVKKNAFEGQKALIVGGTRGLGEVTAKLIAVGSGTPIITYYKGREDAARLASEIKDFGTDCRITYLDVRDLPEDGPFLAELESDLSHLYFFATPKIFRSRAGDWNAELYDEFCGVYVDGFQNLITGCLKKTGGPFKIFYPSTVAIDEPQKNLGEYAAAKLAGEAICKSLAEPDRNLDFLVKRLPRTITDQTATLLSVPADSAVDIMLPIIEAMN